MDKYIKGEEGGDPYLVSELTRVVFFPHRSFDFM